MREIKVVTSESETAFEEKFSGAVEEVEAKGKIIDIRFRTNSIPIRPNSSNTARLYFTSFITYEPSAGEPNMDSIK